MKQKMKAFWALNRRRDGGFTLVELIVVIAILAILAGVAVPAYNGYIKKANEAADQQLLAALNTAYAAACMENGEYDMTSLPFGPVATLSDEGVKMSKYDEEFQRYFAGNGGFKYFDTLGFVSAEGVFKGNTIAAIKEAFKTAWENSSYNGKDGVVETMLEAFDGIGYWFAIGSGSMDEFANELLGNCTDLFDKVFGGASSFAELENAMNLSDEQLNDYIEAYKEKNGISSLTPEEEAALINTIKGNAGLLYFAQATAGQSVDKTMENLDVYMDILSASKLEFQGKVMSQDKFETEYLPYLSDEAKEAYADAKKTYGETAYNSVCSGLGNAQFSFKEMAAMEKKAQELNSQGVANDGGINTLGALYAVSAGYFNSEAYKNSTDYDASYQPAYGDFSAVAKALQSPGFQSYYGSDASKADMEAYLTFMEYLSTSDSVDMTNGNAFSGLGDYMNGAIAGGQ